MDSFAHFCSLAFVNLLHLPVLIPDYTYILLREASLLSELLLESHSLVDVVRLGLRLRLLRVKGRIPNLFTHEHVLLSYLL